MINTDRLYTYLWAALLILVITNVISGDLAQAQPAYRKNAALTFATATSLTATLPTARTTGDLLIVHCRAAGSSVGQTMSVPTAGWTTFLNFNAGGSTPGPVDMAYTYVTGSEAAPVCTLSSANTITAWVFEYSGPISSGAVSPIGGTSSNAVAGSTATMTCPSLTTTAANSVVINVDIGAGSSGTPPVPTGFNSQSTTTNISNGTWSDRSAAAASTVVGPTSVTYTTTNYACAMFEVRSQAPAPPLVGQSLLTGAGR
jgi:hypothetical protein